MCNRKTIYYTINVAVIIFFAMLLIADAIKDFCLATQAKPAWGGCLIKPTQVDFVCVVGVLTVS